MPRSAAKIIAPVRRMTRNRITLLLYQAGSSPSEVARLEKVSPAHVTKVCKGESKSARIQKRIERILRKPWHVITSPDGG